MILAYIPSNDFYKQPANAYVISGLCSYIFPLFNIKSHKKDILTKQRQLKLTNKFLNRNKYEFLLSNKLDSY